MALRQSRCGSQREIFPKRSYFPEMWEIWISRLSRIQRKVTEADYILIGAGAGLSTAAGLTYDGERFKKNFPKFIEKYGMKDMYSFSIK